MRSILILSKCLDFNLKMLDFYLFLFFYIAVQGFRRLLLSIHCKKNQVKNEVFGLKWESVLSYSLDI